MKQGKPRVTPLFIFSLPRSGSTLVQRVLGSHAEIHTVAEPWLLLPFLYTLRERGAYAEYNHLVMVRAIKDFCKTLPMGEEDYLASIRSLVQELYGKSAPEGSRYFLDKTPRYHLIADGIIRLFPEAKFIFLWRNPLAIAASLTETYGNGKWRFYDFKVDFYEGMENLIEAYKANRENAIAVRFEDLVGGTSGEWERIFDYLGLDFKRELLSSFTERVLEGRMGDPTGVKEYSGISQEPLEKWMRTLANPLRKMWCRRYLRWLGEERLGVMGYDYQELMNALMAAPARTAYLVSDVARIAYGSAKCWLDPWILWNKIRRLPESRYIYPHGHG